MSRVKNELEPCGDTISRQEVLNAMYEIRAEISALSVWKFSQKEVLLNIDKHMKGGTG